MSERQLKNTLKRTVRQTHLQESPFQAIFTQMWRLNVLLTLLSKGTNVNNIVIHGLMSSKRTKTTKKSHSEE
jgi:hypothetical protein